VDANREKQELYIHCINVKVESVEESTKRIGQKFENILMEVFV
jgi:multisubunit Na+/H+ antiporter MnhE subunit